MSKFLNHLFDVVLALLVRLAGHFPYEAEDINSADSWGQWGLLWMGAVQECYVMEHSRFMVELRHEFGPRFDYHVWWLKLLGMDYTEGTRTLYVCGLSWQWSVLVATMPSAPYDPSNGWAIEYATGPRNTTYYTSAGSAVGLGVALREIERRGDRVVRLMRESAYLRELQNYHTSWQLAEDKEAFRTNWKLTH